MQYLIGRHSKTDGVTSRMREYAVVCHNLTGNNDDIFTHEHGDVIIY